MQSKSTLIGISKLSRYAFMIIVLFFLGTTIHAQTYVNGNLSTGATSKSGVPAPAGYTWSEVQNDAGVLTLSNTLSGVGTAISANLSVADDFVVPAGPSWDITKFTFYAYQTNAAATPSPINAVRLQIWNGDPSLPTSTVVFGNLTTNVFTASNDALMYRIFNSVVAGANPTPAVPGTTRKIWTVEANVTVSLVPGTYWVEWQTGNVTGNHFSPPNTVVDVRTTPGSNAQQHDIVGAAWGAIVDDGNPPTVPAVPLDMPFKIDYTATGCFGTPTPGNTVSTAPSVCAGTPFTLSVANATTGTGVTYQWQSATAIGGPYTNIAGATADTYTGTQTAATYYQLIVTCAGSPGTSTPLLVDIIPPPSVTTQPLDATVCSGTNTSFSGAATGGTLTYQWQVSTDGGTTFTDITNGGIYSGATTTTLNLTNVPAANDGYQYQLAVTLTGCGSVNSTAATLTVNSSASFTTPPANVTVCDGGDGTFTTTAAGAGLTYQWQLSTDGGTTFNPITGANSATYTVVAATTAMNGYQYNVIITNSCTPAGVTSTNATLTVSSVATITGQPVNVTVCEGANASFNVTASAVSYQWQVSTDGGATFTDIAGQTTTTLNLPAVTAAMNNNQYMLVAFSCGPTGLNSTPATLTVNTGVSITAQPADVTACVGSTATVSVTATGTGPITYQWEVSNDGGVTWVPVPGAITSSVSIPNVTMALNGGLAHVIMSNGCTATITSASAQLTVEDLPVITTQPSSTSTCEGSGASFGVTATGTGLSYQWQVSTDGGATFNDIGGQTGSTLDLAGVAASANNNQYQVLVFSSCSATGNPSSAATLTVNPLPVVTISASPYTSLTTTTTTTITASATPASSTFSWYLDGTVVPSATGSTITVTHSELGAYTASVTDGNGCTGTSGAVIIGDSTVSNAFIYPNPTRGIFYLTFEGIDGASSPRVVNVYDRKGARVYKKQVVITAASQKEAFDLSELPRGVYILEITDATGGRVRAEKLVLDNE